MPTTTPPFTPDVPGRGAWRTQGGLLPIRPGSTSRTGYYRLAVGDETPVGAAYAKGLVTSHSARVVHLGCAAYQSLIGAATDGWFGPATDRRTRIMQAELGVDVDGIVGRATMRALLKPLVHEFADYLSIPVIVLGGIFALESSLDPAAVGVNGFDTGLAQINLSPTGHGGTVSLVQALDPRFAVRWTATDLRKVYDAWDGKTIVDRWKIAVANHNSPKAARQWALAGTPVFDPNRSIQIDEYVNKVLTAW